jgi:hypothetical protein
MRDNVINFNVLTGIEYTIFHGPTFAFYRTPLHEKLFIDWKQFWSEHFEETGSSAKLFSDELSRTTYVTALHKGDLPIAMQFYNVLDLSNPVHMHTRYMNQYPPEGRELFAKMNLRRVITMEYLYVHPEWRFTKSQLPLSEIIIGLGLNIFREDPSLDAVITIARRVVKSQNRLVNWGMTESIFMNLHNNECSIVHCLKSDKIENADHATQQMTQYFWNKQKRVGFPDYENIQGALDKRAA